MDRRATLQWMLAAAAGMPLVRLPAFGDAAPPRQPAARGYGGDPDLSKTYHPGDVWPLTLDEAQRRTAAALCDLIIPADAHSPSASAVGVVDFLDEWVSAPYPRQRHDRSTLLEGLTWIDAEASRRFAQRFADLTDAEQHAILDDICYAANAQPGFAHAAKFFARFRDLTAGGFYSAPEGRQDLGYRGNVRQSSFDGPPREVLRQLGLDTAAT
ncbi:MAG: gluconate 2-dehydrogenase subunit 3 family protein [Steroidobacteraceae bacterium]